MFGFPLRSPYAAAKWGVVGFTKSLSMELGEFGIRVNAILPGIVEGDRIRRVFEAKAQERGVAPEEQLKAVRSRSGDRERAADRRRRARSAHDRGELRLQGFDLARQLDRWEQLGALGDNG